MQLIFLPGLPYVNLHVVPIVNLFLHVPVNLECDLELVEFLVVQGYDSLGGTIVVFYQFVEVLLVNYLTETW